MHKIVVLFNNYGPYHLARVKALHQHCCILNWEVVGLELARHEAEYGWKTDVEDLPFPLLCVTKDQSLEEIHPALLISKLFSVLNQIKPNVVAIAGYFHPAMLATLLWCLWNGQSAILLSESTESDFLRLGWQETLKSWLVKKYQAALVGGQPHKRYLIKLGFPKDAIYLGYDVVDNDTFHPNNIRHLSRPIKEPYFLTINRFIPKKNLPFLLSAYAAYCHLKKEQAWHLVLCGNGPLSAQIQQQISELGLEDRIHLPGFLQQNELLPYLAHANCLIHASLQEQWGLVVNEAMAAGLPVLVSNHCGCVEDLLIDETNGFSFDPEAQNQLTNLMLLMSSPDVDWHKMSQSALEKISYFSPDTFAQGLINAVQYIQQNKPKKIKRLFCLETLDKEMIK